MGINLGYDLTDWFKAELLRVGNDYSTDNRVLFRRIFILEGIQMEP